MCGFLATAMHVQVLEALFSTCTFKDWLNLSTECVVLVVGRKSTHALSAKEDKELHVYFSSVLIHLEG